MFEVGEGLRVPKGLGLGCVGFGNSRLLGLGKVVGRA